MSLPAAPSSSTNPNPFHQEKAMTKYLIFSNPGELDIRALYTFGVSAKVGEEPFGLFGTGFKYAAAILLRQHQSLRVLSGKQTDRKSVV